MVEYSLASICTDIHETFEGVTGLERVYNYDEIPDAIFNADLPLAMVYPNLISPFSAESNTQTMSFLGGNSRITQRDWVFVADVFAKQRAIFADSLAVLVPLAQACLDVLENQPGNAPFGTSAIKAYQFEAERVVINYSEADYDALRITITTRIF